jgi:hypothetical protein
LRLEYETAIRELLKLGQSTGLVADRVAKKLKDHSGLRRERRAFINFLLQAGHFQQAYELMGLWIPGRERVPWSEFLFLLRGSGFKPNKEFLDYFFTAMDQVDKKDAVRMFPAWSSVDPRFTDLEKLYIQRLTEESAHSEKLLFDKLDYFRAHRMIQEEQKLLIELMKRYPEKKNLQTEWHEFRRRWAHHIFLERAAARPWENQPSPQAGVRDVQERQFVEILTEAMLEHSLRKPNLAYDFSLGLFMMEFFDHALMVIRQAPMTLASDWFSLELLLKSRRYLECLEHIQIIEARYAAEPETTFAGTYLRAQVLHGLGQTGTASALMGSIVKVRPNYRSASTLLTDWGTRR